MTRTCQGAVQVVLPLKHKTNWHFVLLYFHLELCYVFLYIVPNCCRKVQLSPRCSVIHCLRCLSLSTLRHAQGLKRWRRTCWVATLLHMHHLHLSSAEMEFQVGYLQDDIFSAWVFHACPRKHHCWWRAFFSLCCAESLSGNNRYCWQHVRCRAIPCEKYYTYWRMC